MNTNGWLKTIEEKPGHSAWYIERLRSMAAEGRDLDGEARFADVRRRPPDRRATPAGR